MMSKKRMKLWWWTDQKKRKKKKLSLMYSEIRRELSMKNTTEACVYVSKAWKNYYILWKFFFKTHKYTDSRTDKGDNVHEKKKNLRWKEWRKMHRKKNCLRKTFLRGGMGRRRERKKAQGIDRSKEMHTQGRVLFK